MSHFLINNAYRYSLTHETSPETFCSYSKSKAIGLTIRQESLWWQAHAILVQLLKKLMLRQERT